MDKSNMENADDKYARINLVSQYPNQLWVYNVKAHRDISKGHFYIPIQGFPDIVDKVLKENWNIEDVMVKNTYEIFLQANIDFNAEVVKVCYPDDTYEWISIRTWLDTPKYNNANIAEMSLKPYYYKDDYNREMIAGQLRFVRLDGTDDTAPTIQNKLEDKIDYTACTLSSKDFINMVKALGLTPKEAIKILLDALEEV